MKNRKEHLHVNTNNLIQFHLHWPHSTIPRYEYVTHFKAYIYTATVAIAGSKCKENICHCHITWYNMVWCLWIRHPESRTKQFISRRGSGLYVVFLFYLRILPEPAHVTWQISKVSAQFSPVYDVTFTNPLCSFHHLTNQPTEALLLYTFFMSY